MKRLLGALPGLVLSGYIAAGFFYGFSIPVMRAMSVVSLGLMSLSLASRRAERLSAIDKGFLLYLALNVAAFWGFPYSLAALLAKAPAGVLYVVLFVLVAVPAVCRNSYFTAYYAQKSVPEALWGSDVFISINRRLTWAWTAIFALAALSSLVPYLLELPGSLLTGTTFQLIIPTILMLGVGLPLNRIYPRYYQRKAGLEPLSAAGAGAIMESVRSAAEPHQEENMSALFKVVAVNGSPHGVIGNTGQMLAMIAGALAAEGIVLEEIALSDKRIEYCSGCAVCLEKSRCWRTDDHAALVDKLLAADGIILASPVYFDHVSAQMKTFIDRCLSFGHKPRTSWKPGLAVSVSAGKGESNTGRYLARTLHAFGGFAVGTFTAIATAPCGFLGKSAVEARARDLAADLARAIKEKRRYPASDDDLSFYLFMRELVTREKDLMQDDYRYWRETGLIDGFESYVQQDFTRADNDPELRKQWLRELVEQDKARSAGYRAVADKSATNTAPADAAAQQPGTCRELLRGMPLAFRSEAAQQVNAVYQFEISGVEEFSAYLQIKDGTCSYHDGRHEKPDVVIQSAANVWLAISRKELNGQAAFMAGKYRVQGEIALLLKLKELFGG